MKKKASVVHCKLGKHVKFSGNTTNLRVHLHDTRTGAYSALLQAEKEKTTTSKAHTEAQQPTLAQVKFIRCYHYLDILLIYQDAITILIFCLYINHDMIHQYRSALVTMNFIA